MQGGRLEIFFNPPTRFRCCSFSLLFAFLALRIHIRKHILPNLTPVSVTEEARNYLLFIRLFLITLVGSSCGKVILVVSGLSAIAIRSDFSPSHLEDYIDWLKDSRISFITGSDNSCSPLFSNLTALSNISLVRSIAKRMLSF